MHLVKQCLLVIIVLISILVHLCIVFPVIFMHILDFFFTFENCLIDLCKPCTETVQHMLQIISAIFHICHNSSTNHHLFCCNSAYLITYTTVICNLFIFSLFYQL